MWGGHVGPSVIPGAFLLVITCSTHILVTCPPYKNADWLMHSQTHEQERTLACSYTAEQTGR